MTIGQIFQKRFLIYALLLHAGVGFSFVIFDSEGEPDKKDNEKRIIEIDISAPKIDDAMYAETITDTELLSQLKENYNFNDDFSIRSPLEQAEMQERKRALEAAKNNAEKEKIRLAKEKLRIQKEKLRAKREQERKAKEELKRKEDEKRQLALKKEQEQKKEEERKKKEIAEKREKERLAKIKAKADAEAKEKQRLAKIEQKRQADKRWVESSDGQSAIFAYSASLNQKVKGKWVRPNEARNGWECKLRITQNEKGKIKSIRKLNCNPNDSKFYSSVYNAVMSSSPLPVPDDKRIFDENIIFTFTVE